LYDWPALYDDLKGEPPLGLKEDCLGGDSSLLGCGWYVLLCGDLSLAAVTFV